MQHLPKVPLPTRMLWLSNQGSSSLTPYLLSRGSLPRWRGPGLMQPFVSPSICAQPSYHFGHIRLVLRDSWAFWKARDGNSNLEAALPHAPCPCCFSPTLSKPSSIPYPCLFPSLPLIDFREALPGFSSRPQHKVTQILKQTNPSSSHRTFIATAF